MRAGHYSTWFKHQIKDNELAPEAAEVETDRSLDAVESRRRIGEAITRRYTIPEDSDQETK